MSSIDIEICVDSRNSDYVTRSVESAVLSGARRVELCGEMDLDGLTPEREHIQAARKAMGSMPGLLCMIRPRGGDFVYTDDEVDLMENQIKMAAEAGANGVVLGILNAEDSTIDHVNLNRLVGVAKTLNLAVTFHRAFDASPDFLTSLEQLLPSGVDRILTSGTAWGAGGSAVTGLAMLKKLIQRAGREIEIVVGGGVSPVNAEVLLNSLPVEEGSISLHTYSGVLEEGEVSPEQVKEICRIVSERTI